MADRDLIGDEFEKYKAWYGTVCPVCDGDRVDCRRPEADDEVIYRDNWCIDCKAEWVEYFTLVEVTLLDVD